MDAHITVTKENFTGYFKEFLIRMDERLRKSQYCYLKFTLVGQISCPTVFFKMPSDIRACIIPRNLRVFKVVTNEAFNSLLFFTVI